MKEIKTKQEAIDILVEAGVLHHLYNSTHGSYADFEKDQKFMRLKNGTWFYKGIYLAGLMRQYKLNDDIINPKISKKIEEQRSASNHLVDIQAKVIETPKYEWECKLFGCGEGIVLSREKGKQPNWFWRLMQYLILGNKWKRISN